MQVDPIWSRVTGIVILFFCRCPHPYSLVNLAGSPQSPNLGPPTSQELRMMGANTSISFKKCARQGLPRPLSMLPPFVPRLFIEDCTLNHERFKGFDAAGRDLTAASKTLKPNIIELQAALMIADVTGFTKLTEILSKKGALILQNAVTL